MSGRHFTCFCDVHCGVVRLEWPCPLHLLDLQIVGCNFLHPELEMFEMFEMFKRNSFCETHSVLNGLDMKAFRTNRNEPRIATRNCESSEVLHRMEGLVCRSAGTPVILICQNFRSAEFSALHLTLHLASSPIAATF